MDASESEGTKEDQTSLGIDDLQILEEETASGVEKSDSDEMAFTQIPLSSGTSDATEENDPDDHKNMNTMDKESTSEQYSKTTNGTESPSFKGSMSGDDPKPKQETSKQDIGAKDSKVDVESDCIDKSESKDPIEVCEDVPQKLEESSLTDSKSESLVTSSMKPLAEGQVDNDVTQNSAPVTSSTLKSSNENVPLFKPSTPKIAGKRFKKSPAYKIYQRNCLAPANHIRAKNSQKQSPNKKLGKIVENNEPMKTEAAPSPGRSRQNTNFVRRNNSDVSEETLLREYIPFARRHLHEGPTTYMTYMPLLPSRYISHTLCDNRRNNPDSYVAKMISSFESLAGINSDYRDETMVSGNNRYYMKNSYVRSMIAKFEKLNKQNTISPDLYEVIMPPHPACIGHPNCGRGSHVSKVMPVFEVPAGPNGSRSYRQVPVPGTHTYPNACEWQPEKGSAIDGEKLSPESLDTLPGNNSRDGTTRRSAADPINTDSPKRSRPFRRRQSDNDEETRPNLKRHVPKDTSYYKTGRHKIGRMGEDYIPEDTAEDIIRDGNPHKPGTSVQGSLNSETHQSGHYPAFSPRQAPSMRRHSSSRERKRETQMKLENAVSRLTAYERLPNSLETKREKRRRCLSPRSRKSHSLPPELPTFSESRITALTQEAPGLTRSVSVTNLPHAGTPQKVDKATETSSLPITQTAPLTQKRLPDHKYVIPYSTFLKKVPQVQDLSLVSPETAFENVLEESREVYLDPITSRLQVPQSKLPSSSAENLDLLNNRDSSSANRVKSDSFCSKVEINDEKHGHSLVGDKEDTSIKEICDEIHKLLGIITTTKEPKTQQFIDKDKDSNVPSTSAMKTPTTNVKQDEPEPLSTSQKHEDDINGNRVKRDVPCRRKQRLRRRRSSTEFRRTLEATDLTSSVYASSLYLPGETSAEESKGLQISESEDEDGDETIPPSGSLGTDTVSSKSDEDIQGQQISESEDEDENETIPPSGSLGTDTVSSKSDEDIQGQQISESEDEDENETIPPPGSLGTDTMSSKSDEDIQGQQISESEDKDEDETIPPSGSLGSVTVSSKSDEDIPTLGSDNEKAFELFEMSARSIINDIEKLTDTVLAEARQSDRAVIDLAISDNPTKCMANDNDNGGFVDPASQKTENEQPEELSTNPADQESTVSETSEDQANLETVHILRLPGETNWQTWTVETPEGKQVTRERQTEGIYVMADGGEKYKFVRKDTLNMTFDKE